MEFQQTYTKEEVEEVVTWFEQHQDMIPETLQLDRATFFCNLSKTLKIYCDFVKVNYSKSCYSGQVYHLFRIREKILELSEQNKQ